MKLRDSENFKKEYSDFQEKISQISDEKKKLELESLLKELVSKIDKIDNFYNNQFISDMKNLTSNSNNYKLELTEIRKKIKIKLGIF
jgi:hypothetical protein